MEPNWQLVRKRPAIENRARILHQIRALFMDEGFLEVETPHRIPENAPELSIDAVSSGNWFLHTSPELCMKRLLAAGYDKLFQICRCWREGERSHRHLPEYTMLEWYRCNSDYRQLMIDCEQLISSLASSGVLHWQGQKIDLTRPWPTMTVTEAFELFSSVPLKKISCPLQFSELISLEIEPALPQDKPLFLIDYPLVQGSLARKKQSNPTVVERFELYLGGLELANGFSELTDPTEQRQRFLMEETERLQAGKIPYPTPENYLKELEILTDAAGIAIGIDRLVMLLCDQEKIDDVVCFTPEQL